VCRGSMIHRPKPTRPAAQPAVERLGDDRSIDCQDTAANALDSSVPGPRAKCDRLRSWCVRLRDDGRPTNPPALDTDEPIDLSLATPSNPDTSRVLGRREHVASLTLPPVLSATSVPLRTTSFVRSASFSSQWDARHWSTPPGGRTVALPNEYDRDRPEPTVAIGKPALLPTLPPGRRSRSVGCECAFRWNAAGLVASLRTAGGAVAPFERGLAHRCR
jgi:hypothetical protein